MPVRDFPGSSKTSSSTYRVSKVQNLPLELLVYCIVVRPYRVSERLEVVSGHRLDTISRFTGSTVQLRSGANESETI